VASLLVLGACAGEGEDDPPTVTLSPAPQSLPPSPPASVATTTTGVPLTTATVATTLTASGPAPVVTDEDGEVVLPGEDTEP
jgi:hypothetical protein